MVSKNIFLISNIRLFLVCMFKRKFTILKANDRGMNLCLFIFTLHTFGKSFSRKKCPQVCLPLGVHLPYIHSFRSHRNVSVLFMKWTRLFHLYRRHQYSGCRRECSASSSHHHCKVDKILQGISCAHTASCRIYMMHLGLWILCREVFFSLFNYVCGESLRFLCQMDMCEDWSPIMRYVCNASFLVVVKESEVMSYLGIALALGANQKWRLTTKTDIRCNFYGRYDLF